jgi:hypothetical protein
MRNQGRIRRFSGATLLAALLAVGYGEMRAQYYEEREYKPQDARYIYVGAMQRDFAPSGSNTAPDSTRISYNKLMPMIGFRQGSVDFFVGYTKFDQRGTSNDAIFVGTLISTDFPISGGKNSALIVPVMFAADYTKAESGGPERDNFNIASLGLGAGLTYRLSTKTLDLTVHAGELLQYATQGLSTGSGFSSATEADASLIIHEIIINGLAVGYRFRYQTWSMSDPKLNYRSLSHGPYLGILF